jgi:hypothetical protein
MSGFMVFIVVTPVDDGPGEDVAPPPGAGEVELPTMAALGFGLLLEPFFLLLDFLVLIKTPIA